MALSPRTALLANVGECLYKCVLLLLFIMHAQYIVSEDVQRQGLSLIDRKLTDLHGFKLGLI